jgi:hypothetical protein
MNNYRTFNRSALLLGALAIGCLIVGLVSRNSEAAGQPEVQRSAPTGFRTGEPVALVGRRSPNIDRAFLLGRVNGQAFYRVDARTGGQCFGVGRADQIGTLGNVACGFDAFPSAQMPVIYDATVGADGPARTLTDADMRLFRLNVIAADRIREIEVAGQRIVVANNIASITFAQPQPLGVITARDSRGNVVHEYDLRPKR